MSAPGAIRTRGLSLRRRTLYPAELRVHVALSGTWVIIAWLGSKGKLFLKMPDLLDFLKRAW